MVAQTDVPESDPEDYYSYLAFARLFGELDILRIENPLLSKHACIGRNTLKTGIHPRRISKTIHRMLCFWKLFFALVFLSFIGQICCCK